ncbi:MAG: AEC family transporter [Clostridia bacterium]|nr:AEC family transporter [Clostridia bacterium]
MFNLQVFLLTLQKVAFLLVVIFIGYFLRKTGKVDRKAAATLSFLSTSIFSPAYVLKFLPDQFTVENLKSNLWILILSICLVFFTVIAARVLAKLFGKDDFEFKSLCYVFAFANTGYFGYPVIEGVFGEAVLAQFMIFCIPLNMTIFSYGYGLFLKTKKKFDFKNTFFSPVMLSYYCGIFMGLTGFRFPAFLSDAVEATGACMSPACMLSIGIVLGSFGIKELLSGIRPYVYGLIRLILLPALFGVILFFIGIREVYFSIAMASLSLPVGLNVVVFPESFGMDSSKNAKICFVSILMSMITLPFVFALIQTIARM